MFMFCVKNALFYILFQSNGAYVRGLFMEGARWDRIKKCIEESHPKLLYEIVPIVSFHIIDFCGLFTSLA